MSFAHRQATLSSVICSKVEPAELRYGLLENQYLELPITSRHALVVNGLPALHKDPFDRILVAQAKVEGLTLLTCDAKVAAYSAGIVFVEK